MKICLLCLIMILPLVCNGQESRSIFEYFEIKEIQRIIIVKTEISTKSVTSYVIDDNKVIQQVTDELKKIDSVGGSFKSRPEPSIRHDVYLLNGKNQYGSLMIEDGGKMFAPATGAAYPKDRYSHKALLSMIIR